MTYGDVCRCRCRMQQVEEKERKITRSKQVQILRDSCVVLKMCDFTKKDERILNVKLHRVISLKFEVKSFESF